MFGDFDFVILSKIDNFYVGSDIRERGSYTYMQPVGHRTSQMAVGIGEQDLRCLSYNFG